MTTKFHLLYASEDEEFVSTKIATKFENLILESSLVDDFLSAPKVAAPILLFLSDTKIKEVMPLLIEKEIVFSVLPHEQAPHVCGGLGIASTMAKALEDLEKMTEDDPVALDVLYCNGRAVFNHIVIGDTFHLMTRKLKYPQAFWKRLTGLVYRFFNLRPFAVALELKNENVVKTVASGIIIVQHRQSSLLSRLIPGDSLIQEGMFHAFILSPRSISELVKYTLYSFFKKNYFPEFGAHIKTDRIKFVCPESGALKYSEDGASFRDQQLDLEIRKKCIRVYPGRHLNLSKESKGPNEVYKVAALPTGEAAQELSDSSLPFIRSATTEEFKELFLALRENAQLKSSYLVLMVLATVLATFGLFANSTPVVIGAMILAPLMSPIITLSMATLRQDKKLIIQSMTTVFMGMGVAFAFAVVITWLTPITTANQEILSRIRPTLLDLGVAVVAGIAGAYAHAREEVAKTLAGVAIAVALVPPLAVSAIGLGWGDLSIFWGASLLLFTNLAGIVLAGALTFLFLGFSPFHLATRGVLISFMTVGLLSIPLAIGFNQMVLEHNVIQKVNGLESGSAVVTEVRVQRLRPLSLAVKVVTLEALSTQELDTIKEDIEKVLEESVRLEMSTAISR